MLCNSAKALLSSRTSLIEDIDCEPGVLPFVEAVLGGLVPEAGGAVDLGPETVRFTPSLTEARGFAFIDDLSADTIASGDATEARGVGLEGGATALPAVGVGAFVAGVAAFAVGARD